MSSPTCQMQRILDHLDKLKPLPLETLSPQAARNLPSFRNALEEIGAEHLLARISSLAKPDPAPVCHIRHTLISGPAGKLLARVYTPEGDGPFPVLLYFHGGGWVIATLDTYEASCRALCNAAECIVISVAYRQAPEHKYPAAVEDAYAALQWTFQNAALFNGDPDRIAIGGESAGGNLATVACLVALERHGQLPVAQLLICPVTDAGMDYASFKEHRDARPLNAAMMRWFMGHYLESAAQEADPKVSPVRADPGDLARLSPAIIIAAEIDPLRDQASAYAHRLEQAGVPVVSACYEGVTHEFFGLSGAVAEAKEALTLAATELQRAFDRERILAARSAEITQQHLLLP